MPKRGDFMVDVVSINKMYSDNHSSVIEIANTFGVTISTIYNHISEGAIAKRTKGKNWTGKTFGYLTAIRYVATIARGEKTESVWEFQCTCGKTINRIASRVKEDSKKCMPNCGCYRDKNWGLPFDIAGVRSKMCIYKNGARKRGLEFNLTEDECSVLFKSNCYYCNAPPSNIHRAKQSNGNGYTYNGIDRADNLLGYTTENTVPCCWKCNQMKMTFSMEQFLEHVGNIVAHTSGVEISQPSSGVMVGAPNRRIFEEQSV